MMLTWWQAEVCTLALHRHTRPHSAICMPPPSCLWLSTGQHVCPLSRCTYILDVASEMEQLDGGYMLWFRRVLWDQPLKFENELYVTMHYNQVSRHGLL